MFTLRFRLNERNEGNAQITSDGCRGIMMGHKLFTLWSVLYFSLPLCISLDQGMSFTLSSELFLVVLYELLFFSFVLWRQLYFNTS